MSLKLGIIGLPNVGKSTLFNALTRQQQADAANYPFCTIEPNQAVVPVPDARLDRLQGVLDVPRAIPATVTFVDIAGLVEGASRNEGLGNQFLGNIRDVDAVLHVVRCFDDPNVVHIRATPEPRADIEIINTELALADLEQLDRKLEKLDRQIKGDRSLQPRYEKGQALRDHLATGAPATHFADWQHPEVVALNAELRFLSARPVIYAANVDEDGLATDNAYVATTRDIASAQGAEVVKVCAQLEAELWSLPEDEQQAYLELAGIETSGLEHVIQRGYRLLGLITYFSFNDDEVRAWPIPAGYDAPQAAGVIHTDFQEQFIRAEVVPYTAFVAHGSRAAVRSAGEMRVEGRDYTVQDGDVILFKI